MLSTTGLLHQRWSEPCDSALPSGTAQTMPLMHVLEGIGAGLIAGGAVTLLPTLLAPSPHLPAVLRHQDGMRQRRRDRTARVCASISAIATLSGATLLLISSHRWEALAAGIVVITAAWLALAWRLAADYRELVPYFETFLGRPKGLPPEAAAAVGLWTLVLGGSDMPVAADPEVAIARARERSSLVQALRRPFGYRDGL